MTATINAAWHERHPMRKNPTVEERIAWHHEHQARCACRPIPAKLLERWKDLRRRAAAERRVRASLRSLLSGGDRRSLARSARAHALVRKSRTRIAELADLAQDREWLVSMRALDLLEKLAHEVPERVQPHKRLFIGPLSDSRNWEIRLQVVRALPLLAWTRRERTRVVEILLRDLEHPRKFVRAWALDSLATFAREDPALRPAVVRGLRAFERSGSKALVTRARHIRRRIESGVLT